MIRFLIFTLIGALSCLQLRAQTEKEDSLSKIFNDCTQIKGIEIVSSEAENFANLSQTDFLQQKNSILNGISLTGEHEDFDKSIGMSGSFSLISIDSLETFSLSDQALLKKLFTTSSFPKSELITFVKEGEETVRVFSQEGEKEEDRAFYIISVTGNNYCAIQLKGLFAIKSHVQITPDSKK
ncbi:hypothetical protein [Porphyromonas circumdentaria]|uniref:DUF4252 domain-containing protein n=1 Tax=Porphyromonas circumdentaria TaxID=29524 RepID=A0A1T4N513_9PORP|nr:hypothetical protein [Porphyromonas circumdentaria]MBB6276032.1 putative RNA-binding protein YlxR (DUF448 family) [Porphyromonas circumdentaria]MDO4722422.1 hypothetical protein [Porphyromonas circumdentaria]SJZ74191.1 hypothetical protein SAMN02745171_00996 [Porphyromonas circumdentaria]